MDAIPVIDMAALTSPDLGQRRQVAARIGSACGEVGFSRSPRIA